MGLPEIVSDKEFKYQSKNYSKTKFRGFSTIESSENFKFGPYYAGTGLTGNGIYISDKKSFASKYAKNTGKVLEMKLSNDAKVISAYDLIKEREKDISNLNPTNEIDRILLRTFKDLGRYAVTKGYDAVRFEGTVETLVLNRTKLLIKE